MPDSLWPEPLLWKCEAYRSSPWQVPLPPGDYAAAAEEFFALELMFAKHWPANLHVDTETIH